MPSEQEVLSRIKELETKLGVEPTTLSEADVMAKIQAAEQRLASLPMTRDEFAEKRKADEAKSFGEKASAFGSGLGEGVSMIAGQAKEAAKEAPWYWWTGVGALYDYEALGDIVNIGSRDFWRFAQTLGEAAGDKFYSPEEEVDREYKRYRENFDYYSKVRPTMLASDEIEYKALTDFGANFVDPFMALPVAKVGSFTTQTALKGTQKALTAAAYAARSKGLANVAKGTQLAAKGVEKLGKGVDIAGKVGMYPTELASKATGALLRKGGKAGAYATGVGLRGIGRLGQGTAYLSAAPRKIVGGVAKAVSDKIGEGIGKFTAGGQVVGAITGSIPLARELAIAEGVGLLAKKVGLGAGEVMKTLGQPASNKRFLYRLATNDKVSPKTRQRAMWAYNHFGTAMGDAAFNMVANGVSIGAINAALAGLSGEDAEQMGAMAGAGVFAGGLVPTGQRGMKAGKFDVARDSRSIDLHMKNKLTEQQRKAFKKLPKPAQVMLATLQESGVGSPKFLILEPKAYLEMLNADRNEQGLAPLDRAPSGHYDPPSRTIYLNEKNLPEGAKVATELAAHETGHDFIYNAMGNDPQMLQLLVEAYKTTEDKGTPFYFSYKPDRRASQSDVDSGLATRVGEIIRGEPIGEPVFLDDAAVAIRDDYDRKQRGVPATAEDVANGLATREGELIGGIQIGQNASKLAQEIGADQFSMMFSKDPNAFEHFHPRLRRYLLDASRRLLTALGMAEPITGNPLSNPISKMQLNNPALRRLYENYGKARAVELNEKGNLAKEGMLITPKKGQTGEDRFKELFGGNPAYQTHGLTLTEAKNLRISNKTLRREVENIKKRYKEEPQDTWSVTKRGFLVGKKLTDELRGIFTRNDPFSNVATILDALQQAIDQGVEIIFGYRSGTKGKYQNPFRIRDVAIYGWQVSAGTLKVMGYDQAVVRHNIQVLAEKGYIKDPRDFARKLEEQGQAALTDPEGRINPEGTDKNTLMTVAFGLKESAPNIRSQGLRDLLESGVIKKSFRSYDVEALAGIRSGRNKAFRFNYDNIRNNYSPIRQGEEMFMPSPREETIPLPFIEDLGGEDAAAGFRRVATDKMPKSQYERFKKGITEKEQFEAIGNQSQLQPFQPRFPRGERQFMPAPAPDSKAFKKWYGKDSPRNEDGSPTLLYHGNVADIKSFDPSLANPEGDLGKAIYLTNSQRDVNANYASEAGPDLTNRITRRAEALEAEGLPQAEAEATARAESLDNLGNVMPVYASMKNAFKVGGPDETQFTFKWKLDENGDIIGQEGTMIDLVEALSQASRKYDGNGEEAIAALMDFVADNGESIPASEAMRILKENDAFGYLSDDAGDLVANEVIREAVQSLGFDGIADHTVHDKFGPGRKTGQPMEGIDESTVHYAVFKPEQVKSAFNRGTWDAGRPEVLFMPAEQAGAPKDKLVEAGRLWKKKGVKSPYFKKWFGKSKVVDENGEPLVVYHGTDREFTSFDPEKLSTGQNFEGAGFYFTNAISEAQIFGKNVHEVYLKLNNPILPRTKITPSEVKTLVAKSKNYKTFEELAEKINRDELNLINSKIEEVLDFPFGNEPFKQVAEEFYFEKDAKFMDAVLNLGYDGVILEPIGNKSSFNTTYIAFSPEQIKSATGNRGTFDPSNPDIQFMPAGEGRSPAPRRAARPAPQGNRFMAPASKRVAEEGPGRLFMPEAKEMVLYHGTNKKNLKNLKSSLTLDDQVKGVSLTPSFEEAKIYAQETAQRGGGDPVVYEVKKKAGNLIDHVELLRAIDPKDSGKDWTPAEVEAFLKKEGYSGIDYTSDPMLGYGIRMIDPKKLEIVRQELIDGG